MKRFAVAFVTLVGPSAVAQAGVEIGGVAGLHIFNEDNGLGSPTGEVTQSNSALFAARVSVGFTPMIGIELEGGLIPTESRGGNQTFDIYDVTARANLIAQFGADNPSRNLIPFVTAGGGMMRVVKMTAPDSSLFNLETGGLGFVGIGAKYRAAGAWGIRVDARLVIAPGYGGGITEDGEVLASLYREWGRQARPATTEEAPKTEAKDEDGDGIVGEADKCPKEAEDKDGFQDDDGCPDPDNDNDGIADATDKCPTEAEDKDSFQDDDGCPDPDNDNDGVADAADKCADQPETKNGFQDDDGCPDEVPAKLAKFTGAIAGINFKVNSADLLPNSNKALDAAAGVLTEFMDVKIEIQSHTDDQALKAGGKFADNDALSQARADAVKAYLVKKGIAEDRLTAKGYGGSKPATDPSGLTGGKLNTARAANRRVEFKLGGGSGEAAAPEPKTEAKKDEPKKDEPKPDEKAEAPKTEAKKVDKKSDAKKEDKKQP